MTDPMLVVGGVASAPIVIDVYRRLLGPWLDDRGEAIKLALQAKANVRKVADRATLKTATSSAGSVPPRVAAEVFDRAQWADDEMVADYLSGVLASARTPGGNDDRGVSWAALVGRLSSDQLRLHYVLYDALRRKVVGDQTDSFSKWTRTQAIDYEGLFAGLGWELTGTTDVLRLLDAAYGLARENLITDVSHGDAQYLSESIFRTKGRAFSSPLAYLVFDATADGISLFLHAHGHGRLWVTSLADPELAFTSDVTASLLTARFVDEYPLLAADA